MSENSNEDDLRLARAKAIEAYAGMESTLLMVFAHLLNTQHDTASVVFYRITSSHARNAIIEALIAKVHGEKFDAYWHGAPGERGTRARPGLLKLIRRLDDMRNQIVHWYRADSVEAALPGEISKRWTDLRPPYYWARSVNAEFIKTSDLASFVAKAEFVTSSLFFFWRFVMKPDSFSSGAFETWSQIFGQPVLYPPESTHPLSPPPETP